MNTIEERQGSTASMEVLAEEGIGEDCSLTTRSSIRPGARSSQAVNDESKTEKMRPKQRSQIQKSERYCSNSGCRKKSGGLIEGESLGASSRTSSVTRTTATSTASRRQRSRLSQPSSPHLLSKSRGREFYVVCKKREKKRKDTSPEDTSSYTSSLSCWSKSLEESFSVNLSSRRYAVARLKREQQRQKARRRTLRVKQTIVVALLGMIALYLVDPSTRSHKSTSTDSIDIVEAATKTNDVTSSTIIRWWPSTSANPNSPMGMEGILQCVILLVTLYKLERMNSTRSDATSNGEGGSRCPVLRAFDKMRLRSSSQLQHDNTKTRNESPSLTISCDSIDVNETASRNQQDRSNSNDDHSNGTDDGSSEIDDGSNYNGGHVSFASSHHLLLRSFDLRGHDGQHSHASDSLTCSL